MKNIQITLAYDGTDFLGWQKTAMGNSIEATVEAALEQILQHPIRLQAASRTDAKVHAEGQIASFFLLKPFLSLSKLQISVNALLPKTIIVSHIQEQSLHFHPSLDALGKEYQYFLCNAAYQYPIHRNFSWHVPKSLSIELMQQAIPHFLGTHDFSAFCNHKIPPITNPICTLSSLEIHSIEQQRLVCILRGNRFLYRMARNIVGTLVYVGQRKIHPDAIPTVFHHKQRAQAGITAPPHGLCLKKVFYS